MSVYREGLNNILVVHGQMLVKGNGCNILINNNTHLWTTCLVPDKSQAFSVFILFNPPNNLMGKGGGFIIIPILNERNGKKKVDKYIRGYLASTSRS